MVISHKNRYLFIEIALTGSWAIRNELRKYYDGIPILHKHASYPEFRQIASKDEKRYFVFASIRNPLDSAVSGFFKYKTNHKGVYSEADTSIESHKIDYANVAIYKKIQNANLSFQDAFLGSKIWERPYSDMIDVSANQLDYVIRYENFDHDFAEILRLIGIEQVRSLPVANKTKGRQAEWESYYNSKMIAKAKKVYGPFMQKWEYDFPASWGTYDVPRSKLLEYQLSVLMKKIYFVHFRYNDAAYAKVVRKLNATLKSHVYR